MVDHPSAYPWSSYAANALGQQNNMIKPHGEYIGLGRTDEDRQAAYRQLFKAHIPEKTIQMIREATNNAWVLGKEDFLEKMSKKLSRQIQSKGHGGDRKSSEYKRRIV